MRIIVRARVVGACALAVLAVVYVWADAVAWKQWTPAVAAVVLFLLTWADYRFPVYVPGGGGPVMPSLTPRHRRRVLLRLMGLLGSVMLAQWTMIVLTGGMLSPIIVAIPIFTVLMALTIGSVRFQLPLTLLQLGSVFCLAWGTAQGALRPLILAVVPGPAGRCSQ
jgi:hypothetical protein